MFRRISSILIFLLAISALSIPNAKAIENGQDATGNEFTVYVIANWSGTQISTCSGALLNDYVVVTAAHCINDQTGLVSKKIQVAPPGSLIERNSAGAILIKNDWVEVDSTSVTLSYQSGSTYVTDDDLAFLTLKSGMKSNALVRIASEDEMLKLRNSRAPLKLYGYGYVSDAGQISNSPNFINAEFDTVNSTLANSAYAKSITGDSCSGDSGGPVVNVTPTAITVVGVITGGTRSNKCTAKSSDGVYRTSFTLLNRYANLAFASASKIASSLSASNGAQAELAQAKARISELEAEIEKTNGDYSDLVLENDSLKSEISNLKLKIPKTILCLKGSVTKKITDVNPKCPTGYKLKN